MLSNGNVTQNWLQFSLLYSVQVLYSAKFNCSELVDSIGTLFPTRNSSPNSSTWMFNNQILSPRQSCILRRGASAFFRSEWYRYGLCNASGIRSCCSPLEADNDVTGSEPDTIRGYGGAQTIYQVRKYVRGLQTRGYWRRYSDGVASRKRKNIKALEYDIIKFIDKTSQNVISTNKIK